MKDKTGDISDNLVTKEFSESGINSSEKKNSKDLTDQKIGVFTIVAKSLRKTKNKTAKWIAFCVCGKAVELTKSNLERQKSCGCLSKGENRHNYLFGKRTHISYPVWDNMLARCYNPNSISYYNYGELGIQVCDRWRKGENGVHPFLCFLEDVGDRPSKKYSLDRLDNSKNYEPSNVKWSTSKEQGRNRRNTVYIEYNGQKRPLVEWAEILGKNPETLRCRKAEGWDDTKIIETPIQEQHKLIEYENEIRTVKQIAEDYKVNYKNLLKNISKGLNIKDAISSSSKQ